MDDPKYYICKNIKQDNMDTVQMVANSLSGGFVVQNLDDATLVRLLRLYTGREPKASYATLREQVRLIEKVEGVDLSALMSPADLKQVFEEVADTKKYPVV